MAVAVPVNVNLDKLVDHSDEVVASPLALSEDAEDSPKSASSPCSPVCPNLEKSHLLKVEGLPTSLLPTKELKDDDASNSKKTIGRKKIGISLINHRQRRVATFHKRKCGLMKKGYELGKLTGAEVLVLAVREESMFSYSTKKLERVLHSPIGRELIAQCLTTPLDEMEEAKRNEPSHWSSKQISVLQDRAGVFSSPGSSKKSTKGVIEVIQPPPAEIDGTLASNQVPVPLDYSLTLPQDSPWLHQPSFSGISLPLPMGLSSPTTPTTALPSQLQQQQRQQQQPLQQPHHHQQQQQQQYTSSWSQMKPTMSSLPPLSLLNGGGVNNGVVAPPAQVPPSYSYYHGTSSQGL